MKHPVAVFLIVWTTGIFALSAGRLLTRLRWRPDIPPFRRDRGVFDLALRPARYAVPEVLPLIRLLTAVGAILMGTGLAVLITALVTQWHR